MYSTLRQGAPCKRQGGFRQAPSRRGSLQAPLVPARYLSGAPPAPLEQVLDARQHARGATGTREAALSAALHVPRGRREPQHREGPRPAARAEPSCGRHRGPRRTTRRHGDRWSWTSLRAPDRGNARAQRKGRSARCLPWTPGTVAHQLMFRACRERQRDGLFQMYVVKPAPCTGNASSRASLMPRLQAVRTAPPTSAEPDHSTNAAFR